MILIAASLSTQANESPADLLAQRLLHSVTTASLAAASETMCCFNATLSRYPVA